MKSDDQDAPLKKTRRSEKPRKADVTRRAILVTTARMFAEKGYGECNLREIAEEVGIKAGSFYYHFRSKDQILDNSGCQHHLDVGGGELCSGSARTGGAGPPENRRRHARSCGDLSRR